MQLFRAVLALAAAAVCSAFAPQLLSQKGLSSALGATAGVKFSKYHGLGNDFLLVDNRDASEPLVTPEEAAALCDRNFGVGADGVIFVLPAPEGDDFDVTMRIYNSDSTEPEMCGNGIRCMARYMAEELKMGGNAKSDAGETMYSISTLAGKIQPLVRSDGQITVDMGPPELRAEHVPTTLKATVGDVAQSAPIEILDRTFEVTCVSMGNPHAVAFIENLADFDLAKYGPVMEGHPSYPKRINAEFVEVLSPSHITMKVWERGAGPTLACGTGACAVAVAGVLTGRSERQCTITLPGGDLEIEWRESNDKIYMTGPAEFVFSGATLDSK